MLNKLLMYVTLFFIGTTALYFGLSTYRGHKLEVSKDEIIDLKTEVKTKVLENNATSIASKAVGEIHQINTRSLHEKHSDVGTYTDIF